MTFKLTYFKTVDLSEPQWAEKIRDRVSRLIDTIETFEIPDDPVIVHYVGKDWFRIMSARSLKSMLDYQQQHLDYVQDYTRDHSGIALSLSRKTESTPLEHRYNLFLASLIQANLEYQAIFTLCKSFEEKWNFYREIDPQFKDKALFGSIRETFSAKEQAYFDKFAACFTQDSLSDFIPITSYVENLHFQQVTHFKKCKDYKESMGSRKYDEICCPSTRAVIDGKKSLLTRDAADSFVAIYMVLASMARVETDEIQAFLGKQESDYLRLGEQKLYRYLQNPRLFGFTSATRELLLEMGVAKIKLAFKGDYTHLWSLHEATPKQNALKMLIDYSKMDSAYPALVRFFTAHTQRHHHPLVKQAVDALVKGDNIHNVMMTLETEARKHPLFNEEGSLMRRLRFITMYIGYGAAPPKKEPKEEITLTV
ncbi:hypothetical protein DIZ81_01805 [Legionella taurinensis]|uniref:RavJ-like C-terminal domain-containing protein n=1 Tax=Legionella taurinensis TaxID=70611 RepID=A0AB38NAK4_9GAMM|nr:DUF5617 domain-containing protein [Legionella taurinensis]MDX1836395.1 DUF5617 domain-containing protein [Legionella taurinensis]PUT43133.1 hypothetical protein DB744_01810 [Legionella taurinensis]PUT45050.1 hypothetical protein DB743_06745 [Legionella taurinensis]PUT45688.1 hypothetical protein DB746_01810 [Legionella taurinensis]PUT49457.1 hypothetical protein DB745_01810 [Legionella taurinensis]